jgi:hypothetical protein
LRFADVDVEMIHRGLERRAARRDAGQSETTVLAGDE